MLDRNADFASSVCTFGCPAEITSGHSSGRDFDVVCKSHHQDSEINDT
jgi:hypothetical protein